MSIAQLVQAQRNRWYALFARQATELFVDEQTYREIVTGAGNEQYFSSLSTPQPDEWYMGLRLYRVASNRQIVRVAGDLP